MPLNIMPAPAAVPGAAPPGTAPDAPPGGPPLTGSAALLFGLLLAQTVGQAAPKAPPALPLKAAPAAKATAIVAETPPALTVTGKGEDKKKDKDKTPAEALTVPAPMGPPPAPPPTQAASPPRPSTNQATDTASAPRTANAGKAMDTVPAPGGELLSPRQNNVPTEVDLVPTEARLPSLPHAPLPSATPSQAVVTAAPGRTPPARAQAAVAETVTVPPPPTPFASAQSPAPVSPQPKAPVPNTPVPGTAGQNTVGPRVASPAPPSASAAAAPPPPVTVATALAAPPLPKSTSAGTPQALPVPTGLQNGAVTADNRPGRNAGGKTAGPPVLATKTTARVAVQVPVGKPAPAVQAVPGRELPQDKPVSSTGREAHAPDTAPPAPTPQAAPTATPSQTAATPMPTADRTQMLAQVTHSLEAMTPKVGGAGPQQMTLQLHPKDWGQLHIRVLMTPAVGADGKVSTQVMAHVIAEHPAVKAALETGQTELRHALREAGLHLDRLTVTVQAPAAGTETNAGGSRQESRSGEGWAGAQSAPPGTAAQGGSAFGGRHPAPSATVAAGQTSRVAAQAPGRETEDRDVPVTTVTGRVDTRA